MAATVIRSEDDAWSVLAKVISGEISAEDVDLKASSFDWAVIRLEAKGEKYHSSMPVTFMKGLIELQDNFLRASALILRDSAHITKLSNEVRADLDVVFVVKDGSTGIEGFLKAQIEKIITKLGDKLTGRQIVTLVLALAVLFGGYKSLEIYLNHTVEIHRIDKDSEKDDRFLNIIEQLINRDESGGIRREEVSEIVRESISFEKKIKQIRDYAFEGHESILSHATSVDELTLQGISLSGTDLYDINRQTRRRAEEVTLIEPVRVVAIDAAEAHNFRVKLRRKGGTINALIRDIEMNRRTLNALWRAESSRKQIMVEVTARKIGRDFRDAKIRRAWTPRRTS